MTKIKTRKSIAKRFKLTKNNKVIKRKSGQGHFNAKESGNITRMKRRDVLVVGKIAKTIKEVLA